MINLDNVQNISKSTSAEDKSYEMVLFKQGQIVLDNELNIMSQIYHDKYNNLIKNLFTSGWVNNLLFGIHGPNTISFKVKNSKNNYAVIDGNLINVVNVINDEYKNIVEIPVPDDNERVNYLVFLEVFRKEVGIADDIHKYGNLDGVNKLDNTKELITEPFGETSKRLQMQYRIRVVKDATEIIDPKVLIKGSSALEMENFVEAKNLTIKEKLFEDKNLFVGYRNNASVDGYVYAIPICYVKRYGKNVLPLGRANSNIHLIDIYETYNRCGLKATPYMDIKEGIIIDKPINLLAEEVYKTANGYKIKLSGDKDLSFINILGTTTVNFDLLGGNIVCSELIELSKTGGEYPAYDFNSTLFQTLNGYKVVMDNTGQLLFMDNNQNATIFIDIATGKIVCHEAKEISATAAVDPALLFPSSTYTFSETLFITEDGYSLEWDNNGVMRIINRLNDATIYLDILNGIIVPYKIYETPGALGTFIANLRTDNMIVDNSLIVNGPAIFNKLLTAKDGIRVQEKNIDDHYADILFKNGSKNLFIIENNDLADCMEFKTKELTIKKRSANTGNLIVEGDTTIGGNLTVSGQTTYLNTANLTIEDSMITLNRPSLGNDFPLPSPTLTSGIEIYRGSTLNKVAIRWNETSKKWEITNDGINYKALLASNDTVIMTEAQVLELTNGSNTALHKHDNMYYTESEIDSMFHIATGHDHNGTNSRKVSHGNLINILVANDAGVDTTQNKHISDLQANNWESHRNSDHTKFKTIRVNLQSGTADLVASNITDRITFNGTNGVILSADTNSKTMNIDGANFARLDISNTLKSTTLARGAVLNKVDAGNVTRLIIDDNARVYNAIYNDLAEFFFKEEHCEPGDVLVWNNDGVIKCTKENDPTVVGVYSDTYGFILGGNGEGNAADNEKNYAPIGLSGRVKVKVTGKANKGDLLTTSSIPGVAVVSKNKELGTIIGKVLENKTSEDVERIWMLILNT